MRDPGTEESLREMTNILFLTPEQREEQAYNQFLAQKQWRQEDQGKIITLEDIHHSLFGFQKDVVRWAVRKGRAAVFAGTGCVAAETLIQSPDGDERIDVLAHRRKPIRVYALTDAGEKVIAHSEPPFHKGRGDLFEFALSSGRKITVFSSHRFLTRSGWQRASTLNIGEQLAVSSLLTLPYEAAPHEELPSVLSSPASRKNEAYETSPYEPHSFSLSSPQKQHDEVSQQVASEHTLLESISVLSPSIHGVNDRNFERIIQDYQQRYFADFDPYDEQLHQGIRTAPNALPLQDDVHEHSRLSLHVDDWGNKSLHIHPYQSIAHHSMMDLDFRDNCAEDDGEYYVSSLLSILPTGLFLMFQQSLRFSIHDQLSFSPCQYQPAWEDDQYAYQVSFDTIVSINYIRTDEYYDMHVPQYENYLANGIWNHNTGKTRIQIEWARLISRRALIVCPLAVAQQTIAEGQKIGVEITWCDRPQPGDGIWITNYEKLHHFIGTDYEAIVLDESARLRDFTSKTRNLLITSFSHIPYRLCCSALPSPNDLGELGNHAEFLGVLKRTEMLAHFFVHDSQGSASIGGWRLKGHAKDEYWKWVAQWAVYIRCPSDLGHEEEDALFDLPPLTVRVEKTTTHFVPPGELFPRLTAGIRGRIDARRASMRDRIALAVDIMNQSAEQWIIWCTLNEEQDLIRKVLGARCVSIEGATPDEDKIILERKWRNREVPILVTKSAIFGHGLNWQHCHNMMYLSTDDSFERYFQSTRRVWRFGQTQPVNVILLTSPAEQGVLDNLNRKEREAEMLAQGIIARMKTTQIEQVRQVPISTDAYTMEEATGANWRMLLGDSIELTKTLPDNHVGLSICSIPFSNLYTYSPSTRDLGNVRNYEEFFQHFDFLIPEWLRVTKPGRRACIHVQQVAMTLVKNGVIAWYDFRADVVRHFVQAGWIYDGEAVVNRNPQVQAVRTKSKQLSFQQKNKDSSWSRPGMADYILLFRKDGESDPVKTDITNEEWIQYAAPVWNLPIINDEPRFLEPVPWLDINETRTLNAAEARENDDERHVCPLQLDVVERCLRLWSNPGDIVFDPFSGIASTGFVAVKYKRKALMIELKPSYFQVGVRNLKRAETEMEEPTLFDGVRRVNHDNKA